MVSTQKLTSMAFAYYDGMRDDNQLNVDQKQQSIKYIVFSLSKITYLFVA